jgi:predicted RNA binding protein YcfA (HicA-like mRNA interferase family)
MNPRLRITGKELIRVLEQVGFQVTRTRGSHFFLRHTDGRATSVPVHSGETVGPGLLSKIMRDTKIDRKELEKQLKQ